ncbi:hypothetical protein [Streptomyces goshikiensis]|uniref:hypothetical protein n=1 Tax=Streptomyces goshikiensis TaxID=1942 RepID=UPI003659D9B4
MSPQPAQPSDRTARIQDQADRLRAALTQRGQRTDSGGQGHDHGLHVFISQLLTTAGKHIVPGKAPAAQGVAELVLDAEPVREALALREDECTRHREPDWELHSLTYRLLTSVDWLSSAYPDLDRLLAEVIRARQRARPFSESVAQVLANGPDAQRARLADEVTLHGGELPPAVAEALGVETGRGE